MTKAARTRQYIIEKTAPVFNTRGYEGTSLSDLCAATGLTKGALYGNFQGKEELASEAFRYTISRMRGVGSKSMGIHRTYYERLISLLDFFIQAVLNPPVKGGCPLLNTAVEADDLRPSMRRLVVEELEKSVNSMTKLIEGGKKAGEFRDDVESRELAAFFFCAIEGAIMYSRVSGSDAPMRNVIARIKDLVNGMRTRPENQIKTKNDSNI